MEIIIRNIVYLQDNGILWSVKRKQKLKMFCYINAYDFGGLFGFLLKNSILAQKTFKYKAGVDDYSEICISTTMIQSSC